MTREKIIKGINHVFAEHLDMDFEIPLKANFITDLQLDSLKLLTLVVELENYFEICFEEGDEEGIETVDQLANLIEKYLMREDKDE